MTPSERLAAIRARNERAKTGETYTFTGPSEVEFLLDELDRRERLIHHLGQALDLIARPLDTTMGRQAYADALAAYRAFLTEGESHDD